MKTTKMTIVTAFAVLLSLVSTSVEAQCKCDKNETGETYKQVEFNVSSNKYTPIENGEMITMCSYSDKNTGRTYGYIPFFKKKGSKVCTKLQFSVTYNEGDLTSYIVKLIDKPGCIGIINWDMGKGTIDMSIINLNTMADVSMTHFLPVKE